jgi:hypothetical protein
MSEPYRRRGSAPGRCPDRSARRRRHRRVVARFGINDPIVPVTGLIDEALESPSVYDRSGRLVERKLGAVTLEWLAGVIDGL